MKSIPDLLNEHPFFAGLPDETLALIGGCGINVHFQAGEQILTEGEEANTFFVLRSGKAAIEVDTPQSGALVIETIGPGEILGVSWFMPPYRSTFDARAVEATSAVSIDAACLRGKCDEDHELGYELFKRFAALVRDRLQHARMQLLDLYSNAR